MERKVRSGALRLMSCLAPSSPGSALPLLLLVLCLGFGATEQAVGAEASANDGSARALLDAVDDLYRSDQSRGRIRMEVTTPNWSRSLELEAWSRGTDLSLFRILAPKKEKGTTTLRRDNEIWNYLPKVRRVMKLPSSMMSASWMGSDFSNDDLVKESRMTRDYDFRFGDKQELDGRAVREILCTPKPDAPVVWGQLSVLVEGQGDPIPIRITYFDEDMKEARVMSFSEVEEMGGRTIPTRVVMQPSDEPDRRTIMVYEELDFETEIPESLFSLQTLKR
jgi:outer membrane lipoprotein-sorting protein